MSRRPREEENSVSLFPFLSILACVIGVLTLMITAMALGQLDPESVKEANRQLIEAEKRAKEHEQVKTQISEYEQQVNDLQKLIAEAEAIRQKLERARAELKLVQAQYDTMAKDDASAMVLAELNRHRERITEMEKQKPLITAEIEKLKAELAKRDAPPPPAQVKIKPGGSGDDIHPYFVECARNDVVVLFGEEEYRVRRDDLSKSPEFAKAMAQVRADPKGVMTFLVRPDAVHTYNVASDVARVNQTRNGKLPISTQGEIDLSLFTGKTK
ncbi:hypothetical protein HED60_08095 [Planctomycetales bacterium ZRK34]|nr:hypothetical protein HED60_08095 [Planctomycetales bacterium ZRK34]